MTTSSCRNHLNVSGARFVEAHSLCRSGGRWLLNEGDLTGNCELLAPVRHTLLRKPVKVGITMWVPQEVLGPFGYGNVTR